MVAMFKSEHITSPLGNLVLIAVFYNILLVIGGYTFLGGFKHGYGVIDLSVVDDKISICRADGYFILDCGNYF